LSHHTETLADVVQFLKDCGAGLVQYTSQKELDALEAPSEHTDLPVYKVVKVFPTIPDKQANKNHLYMVFVDNGAIYYTNGDVLDVYTLDEPEFFTEDPYNFEAIFHAFFLDSDGDLASFAGFFYVTD
jgi:phosphoribosylanthranilate isomerase